MRVRRGTVDLREFYLQVAPDEESALWQDVCDALNFDDKRGIAIVRYLSAIEDEGPAFLARFRALLAAEEGACRE